MFVWLFAKPKTTLALLMLAPAVLMAGCTSDKNNDRQDNTKVAAMSYSNVDNQSADNFASDTQGAISSATKSDIPRAKSGAIKVEIVNQNGKYVLLRGGKPYQVKGVGMVGTDFERAARYGANSIRTWSVDNNEITAQALLNRAHALGMTVSLGLEFARERTGFDYNDTRAVARQLEETRARIVKYKDHPALLTWIIGNEVNLRYTNPKVFDAINDVALMIKALDPNHPTTTPLAGFDTKALADIEKYAPALDFVSFQMYGGLMNLPKRIAQLGYNKPYFVTEWGAVGHWEVQSTSWGAPIENTSSQKAENYLQSYKQVLQPYAEQALGNYVFLWGQKQEKTPTWYGMFLKEGHETETVDVMHYIWTGEWPQNRVPSVGPITLNGKTPFDSVYLSSGGNYSAFLDVVEPDSDDVRVEWQIRAESTSENIGGDKEYEPKVIDGLIAASEGATVSITTPETEGAYRLFAFIYDDKGNAGHANFPFYVRK